MGDTESKMTTGELAELIMQTGHHHHLAYAESDGVDPEWPLWYAGFLQARMWDSAGVLPSRSKLVQLLLNAEAEYLASGSDEPWPPLYAAHILSDLQSQG